jgi:peptidoglycan hydrolase CwlO-like protein
LEHKEKDLIEHKTHIETLELNLQEKQEMIQQLETSNTMFKDLMLKEQQEKSRAETDLKTVKNNF